MAVPPPLPPELRRVEWANEDVLTISDFGSLGYYAYCRSGTSWSSIMWASEREAWQWFHSRYLECRLIGHTPERDTAYPWEKVSANGA